MATLQTAITQRTNPLTGETRLYPSIVTYHSITADNLVDYMVANSNISKAVALAAVAGLRSLIKSYLMNGHTLVIPNLGTFRLVADTKAVDTVGKAKANCIKRVRVRFTPTSTTVNACKSVKFRGVIKDDDTLNILTD